MSDKNGKNGKKPQQNRELTHKSNGDFAKGNNANPKGRGAGNPNKITAIMRGALGKESIGFLSELRKLSKLEMNARAAGLGLFIESVDDYYNALETLRDANSREDVKAIEKALRHVDSLVDDLKVTLPALQSTDLYGKFMIRLLPQVKEINLNIDERKLIFAAMVGAQGKDALDLLDGKLSIDQLRGNGHEEHNDND